MSELLEQRIAEHQEPRGLDEELFDELRQHLGEMSGVEKDRVILCLMVWDPIPVARAIVAVRKGRDQSLWSRNVDRILLPLCGGMRSVFALVRCPVALR